MRRTLLLSFYLLTSATCSEPSAAQASAPLAAPRTVCNFKATNVTIYTNGLGRSTGRFERDMATGAVSRGAAPVHIWRDFTPADAELVKSYKLIAGQAYQELPGKKLRSLCKVNLKLDDSQVAALFGVK